jgi:hemophore-related protein
MFAAGLLSGIAGVASAAILAPNAHAAPAPIPGPGADEQCSASSMASANSAVSASMSSYLQAHPDADVALTDIATQAPIQAPESYRVYFANNPQVADDLKAIQQPVTELSAQCDTQVAPTVLTDALKVT